MGTTRPARRPPSRSPLRATGWLAAALTAGLGSGCVTGGPFRDLPLSGPAVEAEVPPPRRSIATDVPVARPIAPEATDPVSTAAPTPDDSPRSSDAGIAGAFVPARMVTTTRSEQAGRTEPVRDPAVRLTSSSSASPLASARVMAPAVPPAPLFPIDLPAALRLAESINPVIGAARARIGVALGHQTQARAMLLPTLNAGLNYHDHTGNLQRSSGQILNVAEQAFYIGGGARTLAANSVDIPAVFLTAPLTDALFEPLAARQVVAATRFDAAATANEVLLEVATAYLELQGAIARLRARSLTQDEAAEVARLTSEYARIGEGRQADADRAATEWKLRRAKVRDAEGRAAVDSARLVRRLHLEPTLRIEPAGDPLQVFTLADPDAPLEGLIQTAINQRPEVLARSADVGQAEYRYEKERYRPLLPTLWLGFSGGAFGGGSNLSPPPMGRFRGRTDFDVYAFWTLRNFGFGNLNLQRERLADIGAATAARSRALNRVREEVSSAHADLLARREQIAIAETEVETAREGFIKDLERIRGAAGPPLETLDNLRYLARAREALIDAVVGYNQAQFRMFVALGSPPPLEEPAAPAPAAAATALAAPAASPPVPAAPPAAAPAGPLPVPAQPPAPGAQAEPGIPGREQVETLAKARQGTVDAMQAYDAIQAQLLKLVSDPKAPPQRRQVLEQLGRLAEAHRAVVSAQLDYDRVMVSLFAGLGAEADAPPPTTAGRQGQGALRAPEGTSSATTQP